jgi:dienelactone hydrolase
MRSTLHVPETLPELQDKRYGQFSVTAKVDADRVAFNTVYKLRVPAIVYHQPGATIVRHPALIVINDEGEDKSAWYAAAAGVMYANAGAVVLTYDPIGEFERNKDLRSGGSQHEEAALPAELAVRLTGLMVSDILQAANYLASRKDVDSEHIGVLAFGSGSFPASLACAIDSSIRACVLAGGAGLWTENNKRICQAAAYQALPFLGDRQASIQTLNGKRVYAADWASDTRQPDYLNRAVAFWLNEKLKFPDWTKKQIEALAETQTAAQNPPLVTRNQLRAVPDVLWKADQENFIYETWLERARSASHDTL